MALSPELKRMVSGAQFSYGVLSDPLEAKRAEILAAQADYENEHSIRERLAMLGLQKATKHELRAIVIEVMERNPDV